MNEHHLNNPVFHALSGRDSHLGNGKEKVKYFDEEVSPFASFEDGYHRGFDDLYDILPPKRGILYASPQRIEKPPKWKQLMNIAGVQMLHINKVPFENFKADIVPLNTEHVEQMVALAKLTVPGPFGPRTIEFGYYYGIFDGENLVAMTGQRMHVDEFSEVSAVCTHPDYLGRGYATALTRHQVNLIYDQGCQPFLHVRGDNIRAIKVYERLGFAIRSEMNFYLFRK